jgi:hypothetical protein
MAEFVFTPEQKAEMAALFASDVSGAEPKQAEVEVKALETAPEPKQEPAPETQTQEAAPVTAKASDGQQPQGVETTQADPDKDIRPVPYSRFRQVIAEKQERDTRIAELEAKLAAADKARDARPQSGRSWLDDLVDEKADDAQTSTSGNAEIPEWGRKQQEALAEIQHERSLLKLERLVSSISKDYPDIPEAVILAGVNNQQTPEQIANGWDWVGQQYAKAHGLAKPQPVASQTVAPSVAPRLTPSKGKMNADEPPVLGKIGSKSHSESMAAWFASQMR